MGSFMACACFPAARRSWRLSGGSVGGVEANSGRKASSKWWNRFVAIVGPGVGLIIA
jgi:hypothetical protein